MGATSKVPPALTRALGVDLQGFRFNPGVVAHQ